MEERDMRSMISFNEDIKPNYEERVKIYSDALIDHYNDVDWMELFASASLISDIFTRFIENDKVKDDKKLKSFLISHAFFAIAIEEEARELFLEKQLGKDWKLNMNLKGDKDD